MAGKSVLTSASEFEKALVDIVAKTRWEKVPELVSYPAGEPTRAGMKHCSNIAILPTASRVGSGRSSPSARQIHRLEGHGEARQGYLGKVYDEVKG